MYRLCVCICVHMFDIFLFPLLSFECLAEIWEWEDEHSNWHNYSAGTCRLLKACRLCGVDKVSIRSLGRSYSIDLKYMVQINSETKTERKIRNVDLSSQPGN